MPNYSALNDLTRSLNTSPVAPNPTKPNIASSGYSGRTPYNNTGFQFKKSSMQTPIGALNASTSTPNANPYNYSGTGYGAAQYQGPKTNFGTPTGYGTAAYMQGGQQGYGGAQGYAGGNYGAYSGGVPKNIQDLLNMQYGENRSVQQGNRNLHTGAQNRLFGVMGNFDGDPLNQQARANALALAQNPEAINDRTQQLMINRASNLINGASNTSQRNALGGLAARGQLGGSAQNTMMDRIEMNRAGALTNMVSDLEIKRANQRNQDIMNATNMASGLAGQRAGMDLNVANSNLSNMLYDSPMDLSGLIAGLDMGGGYGGQAGGFAGQGGYSPQEQALLDLVSQNRSGYVQPDTQPNMPKNLDFSAWKDQTGVYAYDQNGKPLSTWNASTGGMPQGFRHGTYDTFEGKWLQQPGVPQRQVDPSITDLSQGPAMFGGSSGGQQQPATYEQGNLQQPMQEAPNMDTFDSAASFNQMGYGALAALV